MKIRIKVFVSPNFGENTYFIVDDVEKNAVIIDPGCPSSELLEFIKKEALSISAILLTHAHIDHVTSTRELKEYTKAKIYLHGEDENLYNNSSHIGKLFGIKNVEVSAVDAYLNDDDSLNFGNISINVIYTPGHTMGGVCFLYNDILFTGDTLFRESIGRTDLPGGNHQTLINSIKNKIFTLDGNTKVYPGHGETTTINYEKRHNPFINVIPAKAGIQF